MSVSHFLLDLVEKRKRGLSASVCSVCSANPLVLEATLEYTKERNSHALIESTCNQVNQFGGYTGMKPRQFRQFVLDLAERSGFPENRLILGGDRNYPNLVLEGHSTDYQQPDYLKQMVEDGIAILKVGPALTFAFREAVFLLSCIEEELFKDYRTTKTAQVPETLLKVMKEQPSHWQSYYKTEGFDALTFGASTKAHFR
jgi:tagatose-1,6-bisphosphate aldolase non-catalytic subunit AgaZ/GatZ